MIFLPIKPIYALAIKNGVKRVEFRKVPFRNKTINSCVVYASSPFKRVIGYFTFEHIDEGSPNKIWRKYRHVAGIKKCDFDKYYQGTVTAYAINIINFIPVDEPIDPFEKLDDFTIPQSFRYLSLSEVNRLLPAYS